MRSNTVKYGSFGQMIYCFHLSQFINRLLITRLITSGTHAYMASFSYASCGYLERMNLWIELQVVSILRPKWIICGDFNTIRSNIEKIGGKAKPQVVMDDFNNFIHTYNLMEPNDVEGYKYTWCNDREWQAHIWAKLDRTLVTHSLLAKFS